MASCHNFKPLHLHDVSPRFYMSMTIPSFANRYLIIRCCCCTYCCASTLSHCLLSLAVLTSTPVSPCSVETCWQIAHDITPYTSTTQSSARRQTRTDIIPGSMNTDLCNSQRTNRTASTIDLCNIPAFDLEVTAINVQPRSPSTVPSQHGEV
jgi:hypothetical protein